MSDNIFQRFSNPSPRGRLWQIFALIIVLTVAAFLINFGSLCNRGSDWLAAKTGNFIQLPKLQETSFRFGLDLQGGTQLIYKADTSNVPAGGEADAAAGARDVIERRVNAFGVSEPLVQVNKSGEDDYRIIVELAGVKDVGEAIKMIGETPTLEFKELSASRELTEEENEKLAEINIKAEAAAEELLGKILSGGDFSKLGVEYDQSGSFSNDGEWIDLGTYPKLAEETSKLKINGVTDIVEEENGYYIAKLLEKKDAVNELTGEQKTQVKASHILICYEGATGCTGELSEEEAYAKIQELKNKVTSKNFSEMAKANSTEPSAENTGGELGWFGKGDMVEPFEETVFAQKVGTISSIVKTDFGYHLIYKEAERKLEQYRVQKIFIAKITKDNFIGSDGTWASTGLTGKYLENSIVQFDVNSGIPEVSLQFDGEGADLFEEITSRNIGKQVAIFLDGEVISAPTVNSKIEGGEAVISGDFNIAEAKQLSQRLNAGALPVPITLVSQQIVGATLGKVSVAASLQAGLWGVLLVALFMIIFYRLPGAVSAVALGIYSLILLALFKCWGVAVAAAILALIIYFKPKGRPLGFSVLGFLAWIILILKFPIFWNFPVTLTLPGIAGLILSVGMAVDANVLIFERFKEEMRDGKDSDKAVENGFKRAWPSIRDGNLSTILTCAILYFFSTGMVKGFSVTLIFGVLASMFSAITITKSLMVLLSGKVFSNKLLSGAGKIINKS